MIHSNNIKHHGEKKLETELISAACCNATDIESSQHDKRTSRNCFKDGHVLNQQQLGKKEHPGVRRLA